MALHSLCLTLRSNVSNNKIELMSRADVEKSLATTRESERHHMRLMMVNLGTAAVDGCWAYALGEGSRGFWVALGIGTTLTGVWQGFQARSYSDTAAALEGVLAHDQLHIMPNKAGVRPFDQEQYQTE